MTTAVHQYEDKLLEFAYGELPANEQQAVESHLRGCAKCTQALAEIRQVRSVMQALPAQSAPDAGLESLLAYAEQTAKRNAEAQRPARSPWSRWIMVLSSAAALTVAGVVAFRASQEFEPKEAAAAMKQAELAAKDRAERAAEANAKAERSAEERKSAEAAAATEARQQKVDSDADLLRKDSPAPQAAAAPAAPQLGTRDSVWGPAEKTPSAKPMEPTKRQALGPPSGDSSEKERAALEQQAQAEAAQGYQRESRSRREVDYGAGNAMEPRAVVPPSPKPAPSKKMANKLEAPNDGFAFEGAKADSAPPSAPAQVPVPVAGTIPLTKAPAKPSAAPPPPPATAPAPEPTPAPSFGLGTAGTGAGGSSKPSLAMGGGKGAARGADTVADDETGATLGEAADKVSADRKKNVNEAVVKLKLEEAAAAAARGDTAREVALAIEVIGANATGGARLDALTRACNGLQRLGDSQRADAYCDALLVEFPSSVAASRLARDRGMQQHQYAPASKAKPKKQAADEAPASAY